MYDFLKAVNDIYRGCQSCGFCGQEPFPLPCIRKKLLAAGTVGLEQNSAAGTGKEIAVI